MIINYARTILDSNNSVALELGLIQRGPRVELLRQLQQEGISFSIHLLDAPKNIRHERVKRRNLEQGASFSMLVPDHVFDIASNMWEAPDEIELEEFDFVFPSNGA